MLKTLNRKVLRLKRHRRIRKHVTGSTQRPRMAVMRSNMHLFVQVIDDTVGKTLVSASTQEADFRKAHKTGANVAAAVAIGKTIAERCKQAGIEAIVFDRGGFLYHGRIKALADAAREGGLEF
ncbi:MAG: 50S ribosomal protein L18 [Vampirovibrionales bacterium]|nr:50S ribosomal protein L18 [Vampirovibrionales bacterium]